MKRTPIIIISILIVGGVGWLLISNRHTPADSPPTQSLPDRPVALELPLRRVEDGASQRDEQPGERVADFALQDYAGKTVKLSDFSGRPLVINSWAAWCPFCRKELPDLAAVQKEFGDKVVIMAIDRQESLAVAKGYTDQQGTTNDLLFLLDPDDSFYNSIGGFSMPETIFVDSAGTTQFHKRGPMDVSEIRERVRTLLKELSEAEAPQDSVSQVSEKPEVKSELVLYNGSVFSPRTLRVKSGTTVNFRNEGAHPMWVASDPHPIHTNYSAFDARKSIEPGEIYSFTFTQIGTWGYHDHLKPANKGEVVVE